MICVICDDLAEERKALRAYIRQFEKQNNLEIDILEFASAEALLLSYRTDKKCDLIFMDIYMGEKNGMTAAKEFRSLGYTGGFVFSTTSLDFGIESYDVEAAGYLVKPYSYDKFLTAMKRCHELWERVMKSISFTCDRLENKVCLRDILYIEIAGHGSIVHTASGDMKTAKSIGSFEKEIDSPRFIRAGKSYLVNLSQVSGHTEEAIDLNGGGHIILPVRLRKEIRQKIIDDRFRQMKEETNE